jgi:hypothetical protein
MFMTIYTVMEMNHGESMQNYLTNDNNNLCYMQHSIIPYPQHNWCNSLTFYIHVHAYKQQSS